MVIENFLGSVMLNKKIKFIAVNKRYSKIQPAPKPAYMYKPTWYSMSPVYMSDNDAFYKARTQSDGQNVNPLSRARKMNQIIHSGAAIA